MDALSKKIRVRRSYLLARENWSDYRLSFDGSRYIRRGAQEQCCYRMMWPRARLGSGDVLTELGGALHEDPNFGATMSMPSAGCKQDLMVHLHAIPHPGISDVVEGTPR
jgi:hypothetical protein